MADKKQVMSWLEGLTFDDWHMYHSDSEVQEIAKVTLELLKEQEAVKPVPLSNRRYACGNCGNSLWVSGQRFCASCGKRVKWE